MFEMPSFFYDETTYTMDEDNKIELTKKGLANRNTVQQLLQYIKWIKDPNDDKDDYDVTTWEDVRIANKEIDEYIRLSTSSCS